MNILYIHPAATFGGAFKSLIELFSVLKQDGVKAWVISLKGSALSAFLAKDLAHELNKLNSGDINNFKIASNKVAFELSSEARAKIILETVEALIGPIKAS
jgi:hypothetical protein